MSRRSSFHKRSVPVHVDIDETIGENIDKKEDVGTVDEHVRSEEENRCKDDDTFVPLRSVVPISFDCLYSQVDISLDVEGTVEVESRAGQVVGCFEGTTSSVSNNALRHQRRQPKHKRQQQQRRSALAPTPIVHPLPTGLSPIGPPARAVDSRRRSYIHGTPNGNTRSIQGKHRLGVDGKCISDRVSRSGF